MILDELLNNKRITVLIGKNGCGKSTLLRQVDQRANLETKYISPERGGTLKYDPTVDNQISSDNNWLPRTRRQNQFERFREQSAAQFRNLETAILREIEKDEETRRDLSYTFDTILNSINELLPEIKLVRSDRGFSVETKSGEKISEESISSGESELIALAIESLVFSREQKESKILLLDEPDVHLHPDLQHRFAIFLSELAAEYNFKIVVATHSTAIFSPLSSSNNIQIVPITEKGQNDFNPFYPDRVSKQLLPVFGAHPLTNQFNQNPILLVEGEDDRRVIEQFVRSSDGNFHYHPCVVGSIQEMSDWESWLNDFLPAIYDSPLAFSLRDLDESDTEKINNLNYVTRSRLNCYAIENILLTDECFYKHGISESIFVETIQLWVNARPNHQCNASLIDLINNFQDRRVKKIKDIRNIICALLDSEKPWEVIVGQLLATNSLGTRENEHSLYNYLGSQCVERIFSQ